MVPMSSQMLDPDFDPSGQLRPIIAGVILSMASAFVRMMTDEEKPHLLRVFLEGMTCGLLTVTVAYCFIPLEMHWAWIIFAGGIIGNIGSTYIRMMAKKVIERKIKESGGSPK